jgi:hypothetical protein
MYKFYVWENGDVAVQGGGSRGQKEKLGHRKVSREKSSVMLVLQVM